MQPTKAFTVKQLGEFTYKAMRTIRDIRATCCQHNWARYVQADAFTFTFTFTVKKTTTESLSRRFLSKFSSESFHLSEFEISDLKFLSFYCFDEHQTLSTSLNGNQLDDILNFPSPPECGSLKLSRADI
jgi:hypothetical protein